jgi:ubiquinone/menaquinone biosynthesis C-methylase UbiE
MKLNRVETWLMNNPVREWVQRHYEAPHLLKLASRPTTDATTLVIGCGRGVDIELAFATFHAGTVTAFDLDEAQVARARKRLGARYGARLILQQGDAADMPFDDASFDLVLDFGIIHHIPDWQRALREVHRVLRPQGQFLFEEVPKGKLDLPHYRWFTDHPRDDRFTPEVFRDACEQVGLTVGDRFAVFLGGFCRGGAVKSPA